MSTINPLAGDMPKYSTAFCRSIAMRPYDVEKMVSKFDDLFLSGVSSYIENISSLIYYPFKLLTQTKGDIQVQNKLFEEGKGWYLQPGAGYINMGEIKIERYFNDFRDFNGYTIIKLFLPFLGIIDIDTNEVMDKYIQIRLQIDYGTGKGMYIIGVSENSINTKTYPFGITTVDTEARIKEDAMRVISTVECQVGIPITLGSSNASDAWRTLVLSSVKNVASNFARMSPTPPSTTTSTATKTYDVYGKGLAKGSRKKQIRSGTVETNRVTVSEAPVKTEQGVARAFEDTLDALNNFHTGSSTDRVSDNSLLTRLSSNVKVYIYRPKSLIRDAEYSKLYGRPLGEICRLGDLHGYTEINSIHLEGQGFNRCTAQEKAKLEELLSKGFILP